MQRAQTKAPLIGDRLAFDTPAWVVPTKQERHVVKRSLRPSLAARHISEHADVLRPAWSLVQSKNATPGSSGTTRYAMPAAWPGERPAF